MNTHQSLPSTAIFAHHLPPFHLVELAHLNGDLESAAATGTTPKKSDGEYGTQSENIADTAAICNIMRALRHRSHSFAVEEVLRKGTITTSTSPLSSILKSIHASLVTVRLVEGTAHQDAMHQSTPLPFVCQSQDAAEQTTSTSRFSSGGGLLDDTLSKRTHASVGPGRQHGGWPW
ncbi:hypothetical protein CcaCcLH18_12285 [Colletotrichum camelliae]|nr:hypothetical protein CcaCcLH18_12285 [Colletotrichum camelliae]